MENTPVMRKPVIRIPSYTLGEELFNAISHGIGALLSSAGLALMAVWAHGALKITSVSLFGSALIVLYTVSCIYHALSPGLKGKKVLRVIDHCNVFLLVLGTYIPVSLIGVGGVLGWVLFGIVWGAAVIGIVLNSIDLEKFRKPSVICYILMGWVVIIAVKPMLESVNVLSLWFLLIGGLFYTFGIIFYSIKKIKYFHSIWHLFTVAGSVFQYFSVLFMILQ